MIKHDNGYQTFYAHFKSVKVKKGQVVKKGQILGEMGRTGWADGIHLHFEIEKNGKIIDPTDYIFGNKTFEAPKPVKKPKLLPLTEIAKEVIAGKWGNGSDRKAKLVKAGYDYNKVQEEVNKILSKPTANKTIIHVIKYGDTLSEIALKYRTTVSKIAKDNNIKNINLIYAGQILKIIK